MKPRPIAPRSGVMLALDILEGRTKPQEPVRKEAKKAAPRKPAAKRNPRAKGKA